MKAHKREVFVALVLLASIVVIPFVFCIRSSADEPSPTAITEPFPPYIPPYPDDVTYTPSVRVFTSAGSFSTAKEAGDVYAYFTSNNNPKASSRTAFSTQLLDDTLAPTTRVFVFKNHSTSPSSENLFRLSFDTYDICYPNIAEHKQYNPVLDCILAFTNNVDVTVSLEFVALDPLGSTSYRYFNYVLPVKAGVYTSFLTLLDYLGDSPESTPSFAMADYAITSVEVSFSSASFDGVSPYSSYCDIVTPVYTAKTYLEYVSSVSNKVNRTDDLLSYEYNLGKYVGYPLGYDEGYSIGFTNGMNNAETRQFDPGWFVEGVDAFLNIRLFQYTVGGQLVDFTLGTIFSIAVGGTALLWFIKIFAGG